MKSRLGLKFFLFIFLTVLSIYLLVPTVFNFRDLRETAEAKGESAPWYVALFPEKQISLGLDLQGGIYLELEVGLSDALKQRSEMIATEIERYLKDNSLAYQGIRVLPKNNEIAIFTDQESTRRALQSHLREVYGNSLLIADTAPLLIYRIKETTPEAQQSVNEAVLAWSKEQPKITEVYRDKDQLQISFTDSRAASELKSSLETQFSAQLEGIQPPAIYYATSEAYQKKLKEDTLKQAVETIRNRIDRHGVTEPTIQRLGDRRVVVEIPGVKDPDRAIALVKRSGKLEFRLVDESMPDEKVRALVAQVRADNKIPVGNTLEIAEQLNAALLGKIPSESEIVFEIVTDPISKKVTGSVPYLLKKKAEISGDMLRNAQVNIHENKPYVSLSFNPAGTKLFADLTAANVGKRLAILLDGTVNKAPVINSAIPSGEAQITLGGGNYQALMSEAEDLTVVLREGALPATLTEITKTVIGPSLGKTSIEKGFHATMLAAGVVMLFMALWYKRAGLIADLAVVLNILFLMACLTLFGATLTLPGVAGIVLTIGMAVDANVIILERIKEELRDGKTAAAAVKSGYGNGIRAVFDANITTFLSGVILYQFGTGPVKGFAVTLMVGIITTLYTAVFLTKLYYDYILQNRRITKLSL